MVTAPDLARGVAWVESELGVHMQAGGEHERMATHNALLRLGDSTYLEVIAPNPRAPGPDRARWFELDRLARDAEPRLAAWVARTGDLRSTVEACRYRHGAVEAISRGRYRWLITITADGGIPAGGAIPILIQWMGGGHPADTLKDQGCRLERLEIRTSGTALLECLGLDGLVVRTDPRDGAPVLTAKLQTPRGVRTLTS